MLCLAPEVRTALLLSSSGTAAKQCGTALGLALQLPPRASRSRWTRGQGTQLSQVDRRDTPLCVMSVSAKKTAGGRSWGHSLWRYLSSQATATCNKAMPPKTSLGIICWWQVDNYFFFFFMAFSFLSLDCHYLKSRSIFSLHLIFFPPTCWEERVREGLRGNCCLPILNLSMNSVLHVGSRKHLGFCLDSI